MGLDDASSDRGDQLAFGGMSAPGPLAGYSFDNILVTTPTVR